MQRNRVGIREGEGTCAGWAERSTNWKTTRLFGKKETGVEFTLQKKT